MIQHPDITKMERHGMDEPTPKGTDSLGNDLYEGDEVFVLNDEIYLIDELALESIEILEQQEAERITI